MITKYLGFQPLLEDIKVRDTENGKAKLLQSNTNGIDHLKLILISLF